MSTYNVLYPVTVPSIYKIGNTNVSLPSRMAQCTADTAKALGELSKRETIVLSDLFRSYDMQLQAHLDYASGKKKAFSPPPGGSMHETGRAFDLSLEHLMREELTLRQFWDIAKDFGVVPIIKKASTKENEAWHFECRGSHQLVYDHYASYAGATNAAPYQAMVTSALLDLGMFDSVRLTLPTIFSQKVALFQSLCIRLGHQAVGMIDGQVGTKTFAVASEFDSTFSTQSELEARMDVVLDRALMAHKAAFPNEWFLKVAQ